MSKLSKLLLFSLVALSLLGIANWVADNSKKSIKSSLNLCNLEVGERGWVKGQITEVDKSEGFYKRKTTIAEGTQGCPLIISSRPDKHPLLQQVGARVKVLVKVDSEGFASVINNKVQEDLSVIGTDGKTIPVKSVQYKLSEYVLSKMKKGNPDYSTLSLSGEQTSYYFTRDLLNQLEHSKLYNWYYQEDLSGTKIINRVELVN